MKAALKVDARYGPYCVYILHDEKGLTELGVDKDGKKYQIDRDLDFEPIETWWDPSEMIKEFEK